MESVLSDRKGGANILASGLVFGISVALAALFYPKLSEFWSASPVLNTVIVAFFLAGVCYATYWMMHLQREFKVLELVQLRCGLGGDTKWLDDDFVTLLPPSLVRERLLLYFEQIDRQAPPNGDNHSERVGLTLSLHTSMTRYMAGVLIFLGLMGTFIGLLQAIGSINSILGHLPSGGLNDQAGTVLAVKDILAKPLRGMATGFSTSLLGLVTSLVLGFFHVQLVSAQSRYISRLETLDSAVFQPSFNAKHLSSEVVVSSDPSHFGAAQGLLKENLTRLMTIVERTEGMQANFRDVMMTIGREIEMTNTAITRLSANQDLIRASLSSLVDLSRASGETHRLALAEMQGMNEGMGRLNASQREHEAASKGNYEDLARVVRSEMGTFVKLSPKIDGPDGDIHKPMATPPGLYKQQ